MLDSLPRTPWELYYVLDCLHPPPADPHGEGAVPERRGEGSLLPGKGLGERKGERKASLFWG